MQYIFTIERKGVVLDTFIEPETEAKKLANSYGLPWYSPGAISFFGDIAVSYNIREAAVRIALKRNNAKLYYDHNPFLTT